MAHVLIVEDELSIADTLVFALSLDGFTTDWVQLGKEAVERVERGGVDFVILDVGLPDMNGFEACKAIRRASDVPVLFLTARAEEVDRIVGLEIGADDYVVKPFSPREVAARARVILKRVRPCPAGAERAAPPPEGRAAGEASPEPAELLGEQPRFVVDGERCSVRCGAKALELTPSEYRLFVHLLRHPERVFSRQQLLEAIGAPVEAGYERNVDGHVRSLRAKIRELAAGADPIQTHRGFGYSYRPQRRAGEA